MYVFAVVAAFALVGYPLVADAETGELQYDSFTHFQS